MNTISIKYSEIREEFREGEFYRSLSADNPDEFIEIPADCYVSKKQLVAIDYYDTDRFCWVLKVALFWMLDEIPIGVLEFCARQDTEEWQEVMRTVAGAEESGILAPLVGVYPIRSAHSFEAVIATGKMELIIHAAGWIQSFEKLCTAIADVSSSKRIDSINEVKNVYFKVNTES